MCDLKFMEQAIELAKKGEGFVSPNPLVGAVIVKDGRVIGSGYHERYGSLHAERNALAACSESPEGADMYVTLEPCCHHGKTPPCTDAIIESGIRRVFIGMTDPNPKVGGQGIQLLEEAGIIIEIGVMEEKCIALNPIFLHYIRYKTPYVAMKFAMTLDGKIATAAGASRWITGESARAHVHQLRHRYSAIMVGIGTVIADDPMLDCRMSGGKNPVRIICDSYLRIPENSQILKTAREIPTWVLTQSKEQRRINGLIMQGCKVIHITPLSGKEEIDLKTAMVILGKAGIDSILLEGGSRMNFSALESGIVQKIHAYIAPKIFGGQTAMTPVGGRGIGEITDAFQLKRETITILDEDILLEYEVKTCLQES